MGVLRVLSMVGTAFGDLCVGPGKAMYSCLACCMANSKHWRVHSYGKLGHNLFFGWATICPRPRLSAPPSHPPAHTLPGRTLMPPHTPSQAELVRRQAALMVRDLRAAVAGYSLRAAASATAAATSATTTVAATATVAAAAAAANQQGAPSSQGEGAESAAAAASSASLPAASSGPSAPSRESGAAAAAAAVSGALASAQEGALVRLQEGYRGLLSCILVRSLVADVAAAADEEQQVPSL